MPDPSPRRSLLLVPGFHFDPVWWNTQAHSLETGQHLPADQGSAFQLLRAYFEACTKDPDYRFAIDQVPVLKPFFDSHPEERRRLRRLLEEGRVEIVGASYNQLQSTLVGLEAQLRNLVYGLLYQRDVLGAEPTVSWQLGVFGHDPAFPQLLARCGVRRAALARGPFHHGPCPPCHQNLPSEYIWLAPDGSQVLLHHMAGSYSYGYHRLREATTVEETSRTIAHMAEELLSVASTPAVLVPLGADFARPLTDLGDLVRREQHRESGHPLRIAIPREFFEEVESSGTNLLVCSRELGPIYTGASVTHADLKIAERKTTNILLDAECWATIASLLGAPYPAARLDHATRRLLFAAHHDAIAGTSSDQTIIDLLAMLRAAHDTACDILEHSMRSIAAAADTASLPEAPPEGFALVVFNSLSSVRTDEVSCPLDSPLPPPPLELAGADGERTPVEVDPAGDGKRFLRFVARDVPPLGFKSYAIVRAKHANDVVVRSADRTVTIENDHFAVTVDPTRGGTIISIRDLASGQELLAAGGVLANELVFHEEYQALPGHGEGPWHLAPSGRKIRFREAPVSVHVHEGPTSARALVCGSHAGVRFRQEVALARGVKRVAFVTEILGYAGSNRLLRVHFPLERGGRRPVGETVTGIVGRSFSRDVDTGHSPWTLDMTAHNGAGLASPLAVHLGKAGSRTIAVAEIILPSEAAAEARDAAQVLVRALTEWGVPSTPTWDTARRFGDLDHDSHTPDVRIALGGPALNHYVATVISSLDRDGREALEEPRAEDDPAVFWIERQGEIPLAVVPEGSGRRLAARVRAVAQQLATEGTLVATALSLDDSQVSPKRGCVALLNRGTPSYSILPDGQIALALFRSCPSWPAGQWIDPPSRAHPDGTSFALQHWNHRFEYALVTTGDRGHELIRLGIAWNRPLRALLSPAVRGPLPAKHSFLEILGDGIEAVAVKRGGFFALENLQQNVAALNPLILRLLETSGGRRTVSLKPSVPLRSARRVDPLERPLSDLELEHGQLSLPVGPHAVETIALELTGLGASRLDEPADRGPHPSRYWQLNEGAAPEGFMPFSVLIEPRRLEARPGAPITLSVLVANARCDRPLRGKLLLEGPPLWRIPEKPLAVELGPEGFKRRRVRLIQPDSADASLAMIRARFTDETGCSVEDYAEIHLPDDSDETPPFTVSLPGSSLYVPSGERVSLAVTVQNNTDLELPLRLSLVAPVGAWTHCAPGARPITLAPRSVERTAFSIGWPSAEPAGEMWALIKATGAGRAVYTPALRIAPAADRTLVFENRPASLRRFGTTFLEGEYVSRQPIAAGTTVGLRAPARFSSRMVRRERQLGEDGYHRLRFCFETKPPRRTPPSDCRFEVCVREPGRTVYRAMCETRVPPILEAVPVPAALDETDLLAGLPGAEWAAAGIAPLASGGEGTEGSAYRARLQAGWDLRHLYLAADVTDAVHFNDREGPRLLEGDALRLAFDPSGAEPKPGSPGDVFDLAVALARGRPAWWCAASPDRGATGEIEGVKVAAERQRGHTRYGIVIAAQVLGVHRLAAGRPYGFTYVGYSRDERHNRCLAEWTPGLAFTRDTSLFGILLLA
ncbi:MAG: glycoside hydrolase family 38 C-terminal domain-containing protein [Planctomycetota bacterium]